MLRTFLATVFLVLPSIASAQSCPSLGSIINPVSRSEAFDRDPPQNAEKGEFETTEAYRDRISLLQGSSDQLWVEDKYLQDFELKYDADEGLFVIETSSLAGTFGPYTPDKIRAFSAAGLQINERNRDLNLGFTEKSDVPLAL